MERRVLLAVVLMFATVVVVNILFPPAPRRPPTVGPAPDTTVLPGEEPDRRPALPPVPATPEFLEEPARPETVEVSTPLLRLKLSTRGAEIVFAELSRYSSLAKGAEGMPVQLVKPGEGILAGLWVRNRDTVDLSRAVFTTSLRRLEVNEESGPRALEFTYTHPAGAWGAQLEYRFHPDRYVVDVRGHLQGGGGGWWIVKLGEGLVNNEANAKENLDNLAVVVNGPRGIESQRFGKIDPDRTIFFDGPHWWVAVRDKYFLLALLALNDTGRFGGAIARGTAERHAAQVSGTVPVRLDGTYDFGVYLGPQDPHRLGVLGHGLQDVNPYGWGFLRPVIRPLARGITAVLLWARDVIGLGYGWILILFGFAVRVLLLPLYQSSMRAQMRMAELQPALQELQARYRSDPARLQQEMVRVYRERGMNPLTPLTSGCLPMLIPFPFLIALFFVFRDTIEFRGAEFLWVPDLSRPDPIYVVPVLMGVSMFALSWLGQRAVPQTNPQFKIIAYVMPVMMTIFFLALPAGLNVYYFAMNVASIPQQFYLNRERRKLAGRQAGKKP